MTITKRDREHAALTSQPPRHVLEVGAKRLLKEIEWLKENGSTIEEGSNLLAGAVYESMVFEIIGRGLGYEDYDTSDGAWSKE